MNSSIIVVCPKCKTRVLPKSDGTCPSCQYNISDHKPAKRAVQIKEENKELRSPKTSKIIVSLWGFLTLGNSIDSIRKLTEFFSEDPNYTTFINGWLALFAIIPFGIGWVAFHRIEMLIKHNKLRYAKIALWSVLVCGIALLLYILLFVHDEFIKTVGYTSIFLLSGSFLRYSTFDDDRYLLSVKIQTAKQVG